MANNIECTEDIIGISRKDCTCLENDLKTTEDESADPVVYDTDWYKKSKSGLYIDELEGMTDIETIKDVVSCEKLSDFFKTVIGNSIKQTTDDVGAQINERYKKKESNFVGLIGSKTSDRALSLPSSMASMRIDVKETTGGVMVVKALGTLMNTTREFNVTIVRRYVDTNYYELVDTIEGVNSLANSYVENIIDEEIILPMQIDNEGDIEYFFIYVLDGMQPRNNLASCGCGSRERKLKNMINFSGAYGDDIANLANWTENDYSNGLVLDIEIRCNVEATICLMYKASPEWANYLAQAVLYKTAYKIHKTILASNQITQAVMSNAETINANMNDFDAEYWSNIKYIVQNVDIKLTDCYICKNQRGAVNQILL